MSSLFQVAMVAGFHLFPFRTEKLSPPAPMVLHTRGRVGSRPFSVREPPHRMDAGALLGFARHGHNLTGASPGRGLIAASAQPKTRVSIARWNLKEVGGKSLA